MNKKTLLVSLLLPACLLGKAQYANQTLSNLIAPTAVNKDLRPGTHNAYNLGEPSKSWKNLSLTGILYLKSEPFLRILGTGGTFVGTNAGGASTGSFNTGFGYNTLFKNTTGTNNTASGYKALYSNTTGSFNTANGCQALYSNTIGEGNTATGYQALFSNTTGKINIAYGYHALYGNTIGSGNTAIGNNSLFSNSTGSYNTGTGWSALRFNTTGFGNTANGYQALYSNTTGTNNTAIGYQALYSTTTIGENTAIGYQALYSNKEGQFNTATGYQALYSNIDAINNTAYGYSALFSSKSGWNTALGALALYSNVDASDNTAVGIYSLRFNTGGYFNTAIGQNALATNSTGDFNVGVGNAAIGYNLTGELNTAVGHIAGYVISGGRYTYATNTIACTFLGTGSNVGGFNQYNTTVIGYNARATADNQVVIGNTSVNSIGGYANWTNFSDGRYKKNIKEDVPGLSFIKQLRAVTYTLDIDGVNKPNAPAATTPAPKDERFAKLLTGKGNVDSKKETELAKKAASEKSKIIYTGFLAQEVETAAKKLNYNFSGVKKPENDQDFYGLRYAEFVVPLVKAVQELSTENSELKTQNEKLEARLAAIEQMLGAKNGLGVVTLSNNSLGQNIPNPANGKMTIPFNLSSAYQRASIVFTEVASGKVLKTIAVTAGQKSVTVQLDNVASGTYTYSLVAGNKILDSKKMVVAR